MFRFFLSVAFALAFTALTAPCVAALEAVAQGTVGSGSTAAAKNLEIDGRIENLRMQLLQQSSAFQDYVSQTNSLISNTLACAQQAKIWDGSACISLPAKDGGDGEPGGKDFSAEFSLETVRVSCPLKYTGAINHSWGCTAECPAGYTVVGGGFNASAAYTTGGHYSFPIGNGWISNIGAVVRCTTGTPPCNESSAWAVCARVVKR